MFGISTLTSKGQATIPQDIRLLMGLVPGDTIHFEADPQKKEVKVRKAISTSVVDELFGSLPSKFGYVDINTARKIAGQKLGEKYAVQPK